MKTNMNKALIAALATLSTVTQTGCLFGKSEDAGTVYKQTQKSTATQVVFNGDTPVEIKAAGTAAVINNDQVMPVFSEVTGVSQNTSVGAQTIRSFYSTVQGRLPLAGTAEDVTASGLLAIEGIAGMYCSRLLTDDAAKADGQRRAHNGVNFGAAPATALTAGVRTQVINRYAQLFWRRPAATAEVQQILATAMSEALVNQGGQSAANQTRNALLVACTAALSSLDSIVQ
jgi:hypothetical protein